jgi:hypothetical protein
MNDACLTYLGEDAARFVVFDGRRYTHARLEAFSETVIQGDDNQIVPFADSGALTVKIVKDARLEVYKGAPHGLCTTMKDRVNADLLSFAQAPVPAKR